MRRGQITSPNSPAALWHRWGGYAIGAIALLLMVGIVWYLVSGTASTKREVAATPMLMLPPPPPPPPEPEKLPEPEPEKVQPEVAPEPTPAPQEPISDTPTPSKDLGDPVTIDGAAEAGTDSFGIAAGRGGGSTGGGGGMGSFSQYLQSGLEQAMLRDSRTRSLVYQEIRYNVWMDADGRVTRVELVQSSGDAKIDEAVLSVVRSFSLGVKPNAQRFPVRLTSRGRRP